MSRSIYRASRTVLAALIAAFIGVIAVAQPAAAEDGGMEWVSASEVRRDDDGWHSHTVTVTTRTADVPIATSSIRISPCGPGEPRGWVATAAEPGSGRYDEWIETGGGDESVYRLLRPAAMRSPEAGIDVAVELASGERIYRSGCVEVGTDLVFPDDDVSELALLGSPPSALGPMPDESEADREALLGELRTTAGDAPDPFDDPDDGEMMSDEEWVAWALENGVLTPEDFRPDAEGDTPSVPGRTGGGTTTPAPPKPSEPPVKSTWWLSMAGLGLIAGLSRLRDRDLAYGERSGGGMHPYMAIGIAVIAIASGIGSLTSIRTIDHPSAIAAALATAVLLGWVLASRRAAWGGRLLTVDLLRDGWETGRGRIFTWVCVVSIVLALTMSDDVLGMAIGAGVGFVLGAADAGVSARRIEEAMVSSITESLAGVLGVTSRVLDEQAVVSVTHAGTIRVTRLPGSVQARIAADPGKVEGLVGVLMPEWVVMDLAPTHIELRRMGAHDAAEAARRDTVQATGGAITGLDPVDGPATPGGDDPTIFDFTGED